MIISMAKSALDVLLAGLFFGAGLPMIFTMGITLWSKATSTVNEDGTVQRNYFTLAAAGVCFLVVIVAILVGVLWITRKSMKHYLGIAVFG